MTTYVSHTDSPLGLLRLTGDGSAITGITLADHQSARDTATDWITDDAPFALACAQLAAYFAGRRVHFDLPLAPSGTAFQRQVWQALIDIPYGHTESYGALAARIGRPGAARAVGLANARNPIAVVVPCHRVIGASGKLTGYAGGLDRKAWLLDLENRWTPTAR